MQNIRVYIELAAPKFLILTEKTTINSPIVPEVIQ